MKKDGFTTSFTVDQTPEEVFNAVNNVRGWWSGEVVGDTDKVGAEFTYRYKNFHMSRQHVTELVPGRKVVWHVTDADLTFFKDKTEWIGTDIVFEIVEKAGKIRRARALLDAVGSSAALEVDGGISRETINACWRAGADTFVAGNAVFGAKDPAAEVRALRALCAEMV